jgi:hypothetical protein
MFKTFLAGKSRRLYKTLPAYAGQESAEFILAKAGVALQTAPLNVYQYTLRGSFLARLASEHF